MKLSGHSYNNDVFDSLLDGLSGNVVLNKQAKQDAPKVAEQVFSSTTESDMQEIMEDEIRQIASELQFAADIVKVAVSTDDLIKFAKFVKDNQLRGKELERSARKYCNELYRVSSDPIPNIKRNASLLDQMGSNSIVPAGYNTEYGPGDNKTGGYMGMSKNPNSIWNSDALKDFATKVSDRQDMLGDEQIKESQKSRKDYRQSMKDGEWQEKQEKLSDKSVVHNKIANVSTGQETGYNQTIPKNTMSMFDSNNRDFENIPEKTLGELLKDAAKSRSDKKADAKVEWNCVKPTSKVDQTLSNLFAGDTQNIENKTSSQRDALDHVFASLLP